MRKWFMPAVFIFSLCVSFAVVELAGDLAVVGAALLLPISLWYPVEGQRGTQSLVAMVFLISFMAIGFTSSTLAVVLFDESAVGLKKFSSHEELETFLKTNLRDFYLSIPRGAVPSILESELLINGGTTGGLTDFSTTNIQVEGVDEADIVKCDGKYIYVVSGDKVITIDAYPAEDVRILSEIQENGYPREIFINGDKLVILGRNFANVYDVSDRENPVLVREIHFDGYYFNSRMIGNYVYLIISSPQIYYPTEEISLPEISCNGDEKSIQATDVYYFENLYGYSYQFTTIMAINTQDDNENITSETFLMSSAQNLFVSLNNIYITYSDYWAGMVGWTRTMVHQETTEKTIIYKISIADGKIEYKSKGEVPGQVLNQFSMDEYQGYFRIATTTGWYGANHVYVLDQDLSIAGKLENLAQGERIYSARFMGSRAYLVTFKNTDPLFVIDLSDPYIPKVLGELKIPGYSNYLHPYDETHIIGVGKEAVDEGSFAWYQGVKIALFDVSDPENPVEISKYVIGDRGTDSYALRDHRAFLFSKSKNLLVIPILLAEIDENDYSEGVPPYAYGDYVWQGAYVFDISLINGLVLKGGITHSENAVQSRWYWYGSYSVKRSLYINNVLYTVSDGLIKMNNLDDLSEINSVQLPAPAEPAWISYWE